MFFIDDERNAHRFGANVVVVGRHAAIAQIESMVGRHDENRIVEPRFIFYGIEKLAQDDVVVVHRIQNCAWQCLFFGHDGIFIDDVERHVIADKESRQDKGFRRVAFGFEPRHGILHDEAIALIGLGAEDDFVVPLICPIALPIPIWIRTGDIDRLIAIRLG